MTNAVFGAATVPESVPPIGTPALGSAVINRLAWIVTVTSPHPSAIPSTCPPRISSGGGSGGKGVDCPPGPLVSHDNLVLDATTGKMVAGFFT